MKRVIWVGVFVLAVVSFLTCISSVIPAHATDPSILTTITVSDYPAKLIYRDNLLYVMDGTEPGCLSIVDVNDPYHPFIRGSVPLGGPGIDIDLQGDKVYIASHRWGVDVIDVSNSDSPARLTAFGGSGAYYSVCVGGSYAYVTYCHNGFEIFNISNPSSPYRLSSVSTPYCGQASTVNGNYAYVTLCDRPMRIYDVSNPGSPLKVSEYSWIDHGRKVIFEDNRLYLAGDGLYHGIAHGFQIIDVSNPYNPTLLGSIDTKQWGVVYSVAKNGNYVYAVTNGNYLLIINAADPSNPVIEKAFAGGGRYDIVVNGRFAYVADELYDGLKVIDLGSYVPNQAPVANAGPNLTINTEEQSLTVIQGTAADPDGDALTYQWLEGTNPLTSWQTVEAGGAAPLELSGVSQFSIGEHTLILKVRDATLEHTDSMILTVENSAPHPAPTGGGVYEIGTSVVLGGQVSDFDGDLLDYEWLNGSQDLCSGEIQPPSGGGPVTLPDCTISSSDLGQGSHTLTLRVDDGVNTPVTNDVTVQVVDTGAPTLAPEPNKTLLWPPNHRMVNITIRANAGDAGGGPITLAATVRSNEPVEGLGDGDTSPDWTEPAIDQETGIITLQLRAERSGRGEGRIYTITITARDESGNASQAEVEIIVPHDRG